MRGVIGDVLEPGWEPVSLWATHHDATEPVVELTDDDPVELLYTSGTESRPKGTILTSRSLIAQHVSCFVDGEMTPDDVEVHALPLFHSAQLHCFFTPSIHLGAVNVLLPKADPAAMLAAVEAERATKLFCPPTVWIALLNHPDLDRRDLSSLRKGYYGASVMPVEVLAELGERLPGVRLFNFYGQTEMSPVATVLGPEDQVRKAGSAGRPALNVETQVVDDDGRPVAAGEVGEIVHRSPQAMLGYWDDAAKTAETFRDGWLHTGDLGILDDEGYLYVVDRKKDMIKSGGENVASREVEEVIHAHPAVAEAAVFGIPHPRWIEAVAAVVVPRAGHELAAEEITRFCRDRLAGFKTPRYVVDRRRAAQEPEREDPQARAAHHPRRPGQGDEPMSTIVIIDHGVVGDREVERSVLEAAGHDVIDTQELGLSAEEGFDLAVERDAVAILAGPIIPLDRAHLERLESCLAVVRYGVGLDNVDIDVAQELGIAVGNVPEYGHEEISNHAIALLLALSRKLFAFDAAVRRGGTGIPAPQSVARLSRRTLGLVGYGRIGRRVAEKARAFGLEVVAYDPYASTADGVELLELDELLRRADILSLHVPLTPETRHMIGARELALLAPGSLVINIGRGGLVDEDALVAALHSGHIAGAALDVTEIEPLPLSSPLLDAPNVILTPHVAWVSEVALSDLKRLTAENALRLIGAREPVTV